MPCGWSAAYGWLAGTGAWPMWVETTWEEPREQCAAGWGPWHGLCRMRQHDEGKGEAQSVVEG